MDRRTTWILVAVAALLGLYVLYTQQTKNNATANATATPGFTANRVWDVTADQIVGVSFVDKVGNRSVAFSKDAQGNWQVTAPEARPADPLAVSSAVAQLTNMSLNTTLTTTTDLAPFGVLSPTYTLELKLVDGAQLRASIGDKTPLGTEYYVLRNGEQNAIVINSGNIESLVALLDSPPYFVPTETPSPTVDAAATILAPSATPGAPQSTPSATP